MAILLYQIISLIVAPLFVSLVNTLVSHLLEEKDDD
ncbi:type I toxin-antitoxin system Fst family toxin [Enterococcus durans]|nr:type I toxin-antitoxin system Fst family toxin [Enterococcus durans]